MRIGINLLFLKPGIAGGTETYSYGLLQGLMKVSSSKDEFFVFCNRNVNPHFLQHDLRFKTIKYNVGKSVASRCLYEQFVFPFKLKKYKLNVLHSLGYTGPVVTKHHIVTIHDANAFVHTDMNFLKRLFLSFLMKQTAKSCTHIIAVSQFSKQEILKYIKVKATKISVVYEACKYPPSIKKYTLPEQFKFIENENYLVALSSVTKNKNINTLITAFKELSAKYPQLKLILIGYLPPDNSIQKTIEKNKLKGKIIITGYLNERDLIALFQHSISFVFPSLYEGFGLPLLEAQNLGVPVIASDKGALPEIGKDSVLYFNGSDTKELAKKIQMLLSDQSLRKYHKNAGYNNAKRFSWDATASKTLELYTQYSN